jgi:hypothetical protein
MAREFYLNEDGVFGPHDTLAAPETVVRTTAQALSEPQKLQARTNIGAGTGEGGGGGFSGAYNDLTGKPTLGTAAALNVPASGNAASGEVVKGDDTRLSSGGSTDPRGAYLASVALHAWPLDEVSGSRLDRKNSAHLLEVGGSVGSATVSGRTVLSTSGGSSYLRATNAGGLLMGSPNKFGTNEAGRTYCFWVKRVDAMMPLVFLPYPGTLRFYYAGTGMDIFPHGNVLTSTPVQEWYFVCSSMGGQNQIAWSVYGIPSVIASTSASDATAIHVGNSTEFASPSLQMRDLYIFDIGPDKFRQEHYEFLYNFGAGRHWSELV